LISQIMGLALQLSSSLLLELRFVPLSMGQWLLLLPFISGEKEEMGLSSVLSTPLLDFLSLRHVGRRESNAVLLLYTRAPTSDSVLKVARASCLLRLRKRYTI
jgi:hypothetical protein